MPTVGKTLAPPRIRQSQGIGNIEILSKIPEKKEIFNRPVENLPYRGPGENVEKRSSPS